MGAQPAGAPLLTGSVPPLAPFYRSRRETGFGLAERLRPGQTVLLGPTLPGAGGTGKTQLALGFAHAMWSTRAVDLLAWIPAGSREAVVAGYARATADLELLSPQEAAATTADARAERFLDWLRGTDRRWAVVLDGVRSPADLEGMWPQGPAGQVVVTTRLREAELGWPGAGLTGHAVPGFSRREALAYLNARLTGFPDQRIEALDLAEDLGGMPIALAQAAAFVTVKEITGRDYRAEHGQRLRATAGTVVDGCPPPLLATWSLAVEQAHELPPDKLAWPALVFASMLDTSGIPAAVLTSPAACAYITGKPADGLSVAGPAQNQVRAAYANLDRLGLLSVDRGSTIRTVWLHSAVRAAVRAYLAPGSVPQVVAAAASALVEAWPDPGTPASSPQLSLALRESATALHAYAGELLWASDAHPVLVRAGMSLRETPVHIDAAVRYWHGFSAAAGQLLGHGHPQSSLARDRLTDAYAAGGRAAR